MSDPVTNTEIEDVLTSIRRLVSENRPLSNSMEPEAPKPESVSPDADESAEGALPLALVLTPALRVDDEEQETAEDANTPLEDSDEQPWDEDAAVSEEDLEMEEGADIETTQVPDTVEVSYDHDSLGNDAHADTESAISSDVVEEEEANVEMDDDDLHDFQPEVSSEGDVALEEDVDEDQPFDFKQVLEARIHHFRDAKSSEGMPPKVENDTFTETIIDELNETLPDDVVDALGVDEGEAVVVVDDAAEIDEAILREMVADIVRQELQGALGERITRNVRKLVRREIHRALAAHDLG
ncbi:hypothetical protein [Shimia sp.]|uniref:hypothetical protein n=1 Tax=Shimia sp. TaxID=1954381 RepID=UPI003B8D4BE7